MEKQVENSNKPSISEQLFITIEGEKLNSDIKTLKSYNIPYAKEDIIAKFRDKYDQLGNEKLFFSTYVNTANRFIQQMKTAPNDKRVFAQVFGSILGNTKASQNKKIDNADHKDGKVPHKIKLSSKNQSPKADLSQSNSEVKSEEEEKEKTSNSGNERAEYHEQENTQPIPFSDVENLKIVNEKEVTENGEPNSTSDTVKSDGKEEKKLTSTVILILAGVIIFLVVIAIVITYMFFREKDAKAVTKTDTNYAKYGGTSLKNQHDMYSRMNWENPSSLPQNSDAKQSAISMISDQKKKPVKNVVQNRKSVKPKQKKSRIKNSKTLTKNAKADQNILNTYLNSGPDAAAIGKEQNGLAEDATIEEKIAYYQKNRIQNTVVGIPADPMQNTEKTVSGTTYINVKLKATFLRPFKQGQIAKVKIINNRSEIIPTNSVCYGKAIAFLDNNVDIKFDSCVANGKRYQVSALASNVPCIVVKKPGKQPKSNGVLNVVNSASQIISDPSVRTTSKVIEKHTGDAIESQKENREVFLNWSVSEGTTFFIDFDSRG